MKPNEFVAESKKMSENNLDIHRNIILKCILKRLAWKGWTGFEWLRVQLNNVYENSNESSGSMKLGNV